MIRPPCLHFLVIRDVPLCKGAVYFPMNKKRCDTTPDWEMVRCWRFSLLSVFLLLAMGISGCATHADRVRGARDSFYSGNILTAREKIDKEIKKGKTREIDVLKLDQALIDLFAGDCERATSALRETRDRFDYLEQKSLSEGTLAMLTDENTVSYCGEDYEKVMIRVLLTLSDLVQEGGDAEAYALQINAKQDEIVRKGIGNVKIPKNDPQNSEEALNPKLSYKQLAIGHYLRGVIREETLTNYDDSHRAYQQVAFLEPGFSPIHGDIVRVCNSRHSQQGNGVLYVFSFVGKGPYKERDTADATQLGLLIADQIFSATNKYSVPPTVAPVPIPRIVVPENRVQSVGISLNGRSIGRTETITDVGKLANEQFEANRDAIIARAIMRRIVKKGTVYTAKEMIEVNPWISFAMDLGGIAWEATESADTRCWALLPGKIQVLRLELPEGEHELGLQALGWNAHPVGQTYTKKIRIRRGLNTYVLANFPDQRMIGKIQSNESVEEKPSFSVNSAP